nr:MAG TPA: nucleotidase 5'-nucleotidase [Inoviridae sp.]
MLRHKSVALDFDGTMAFTTPETYPYIDAVNYKAIEVMKKYKEAGGKIVLFTCRTDTDLDIAIECLREYGLEVDTVNEDLQETIDDWYKIQPDSSISPKVFVDVYIDDRAFPACRDGLNWDDIEKYILEMY